MTLLPPPALLQFIACFNRGEFWESHETLEPDWRQTRSPFYHALILYASAWVHVERRNLHGILAQLGKAAPLLEGYRPAYLGIDVEEVLRDCRRLQALADQGEPEPSWRPALVVLPGFIKGTEPELILPG